jgi:ribosome-associated toxin RatA of RatAB toxin-antitoxin module
MKPTCFIAIFVLFTTWTSVCGASFAQSQLPSAIRHLADGHIENSSFAVKGTTIQGGRAEAIINAPVDEVLSAIFDYGNYAQFLPHFRTSKVLSKRGANAIVYMEALIIKDTYKIWAQESFRERALQGSTRVVEGKMLKGNVARLDARWEVTPIDGNRSLVAFQMLLDPNLPLPASVISNQNAIAARRTIKALRDKRIDPKKPKS